MRTPLTWLNLLHDRTRAAAAISGVAFAVVLVLMQLGFLNAVEQTANLIYSRLDCQVLLISRRYVHISKAGTFPRMRLQEALAVRGVRDAKPLYLRFSLWRSDVDGPTEGRRRGIFVMGFNLNEHVFSLDRVERQIALLKRPGAALMDTHSRPEFGPWEVGSEREVGQSKITLAGSFDLGTGFAADGAIIVGDQTFCKLFPGVSLADVSMGLVGIEPGQDAQAVADRLNQSLPDDVRALSLEQVQLNERTHWVDRTSVGIIFKFGVFVGFIVGIAIVYQVLSSDISNHLAEYATLKAMGYGPGFLSGVVFQQAMILAIAGFIPGWAISKVLYWTTSASAHVPMELSNTLALEIFGMSLVMCSISGLAALRKVNNADPAELFN